MEVNAYLREFKVCAGERFTVKACDNRTKLVRKYAWAVPNETALNTIAEHAPIVEIGAGTGYWAYLLREMGVDIVCYDISPPHRGNNKYKHGRVWTDVKYGGVPRVHFHADRTLFLCWPPYSNDMAVKCVRHYKGDRVIYIGESQSGCNATPEFFWLVDGEPQATYEAPGDDDGPEYHEHDEAMARAHKLWGPPLFKRIDMVSIPRWDMIHDWMYVYERV